MIFQRLSFTSSCCIRKKKIYIMEITILFNFHQFFSLDRGSVTFPAVRIPLEKIVNLQIHQVEGKFGPSEDSRELLWEVFHQAAEK